MDLSRFESSCLWCGLGGGERGPSGLSWSQSSRCLNLWQLVSIRPQGRRNLEGLQSVEHRRDLIRPTWARHPLNAPLERGRPPRLFTACLVPMAAGGGGPGASPCWTQAGAAKNRRHVSRNSCICCTGQE